jgi:hypothetical protein
MTLTLITHQKSTETCIFIYHPRREHQLIMQLGKMADDERLGFDWEDVGVVGGKIERQSGCK